MYHHLNNYEAYAYCFQTLATVLNLFGKTCFQISADTYLIFREAIMHKMLVTNDLDLVPLVMTGRTGGWDMTTFKRDYLKILAILGGQILGIPTADPILASVYIRKYGVDQAIKYGLPADFQNGFYQNNHSCAGHFRTRKCIITCKGFTNILWGA
jgi:chondroitin-sulfate-ABC endolyase/exolyase